MQNLGARHLAALLRGLLLLVATTAVAGLLAGANYVASERGPVRIAVPATAALDLPAMLTLLPQGGPLTLPPATSR